MWERHAELLAAQPELIPFSFFLSSLPSESSNHSVLTIGMRMCAGQTGSAAAGNLRNAPLQNVTSSLLANFVSFKIPQRSCGKLNRTINSLCVLSAFCSHQGYRIWAPSKRPTWGSALLPAFNTTSDSILHIRNIPWKTFCTPR